MTAALHKAPSAVARIEALGLLPEWTRVELLCVCFMQAREGPAEDVLERLKQVQEDVQAGREAGVWKTLEASGDVIHDSLCQDLLACIYAPQAVPRIGWMLQDLQHHQNPAPSEALIVALLAIPDTHLESVRHALLRLEQAGLITRDRSDPFTAIQPDHLALSRLLKRSLGDWAPPGAYPVKRRAGWQELVLPAEQVTMLREFLLWIQHRDTVVDEWGGQVCGGPVALLAGPSGTGKTLAAAVLAGELGWPLYRVDLAALVSKYVGETEKNIGRLFDATHGRRVILQFDEVDALMGKRGDLREARDRYANMEVSYLLARIEDHDGPCLLTTNLRSQIDKAFLRRFQMVVEFPRPDSEQREQLWRRLLPPRAPVSDALDFRQIAEAVNLTGGQIRNAALHAAYLAAEQGTHIDTTHIARAVLRELAKEQNQVSASQLGALAGHLNNDEGNTP